MSITREFHGFLVSDDFVLTLNSKGGTVDVNLQECMAIRLANSVGMYHQDQIKVMMLLLNWEYLIITWKL